MLVALLEAEDVTGEAEARDLAAPVGGHAADADGTEFDEVEGTASVALGVDRGFQRIERDGARLRLRQNGGHAA